MVVEEKNILCGCGVCVALFALACAEYTILACQVAEEGCGRRKEKKKSWG